MMGLKVWFPFLGDLNQQGCSDVKATNLGAVTSSNSGKIGKCMSFNGSATGALRLPPVLKATDDFSICFWVKFNNLSVNHCLFSQRTAINDLGYTIFWIQGQTGIRLDAGGQSSGGYTRITDTSKWYHVVCCRDSSKKYIYINGELISSVPKTTVQTSNINSNYAIIGGSQNSSGGSTSDANYLNGYLNDYRIYDHCLSAAEVREISQGLVLHYKLDGSMGGTHSNLAQGSKLLATASSLTNCNISKRGSPTIETRTDGFVQVKGTAAWQGFSLWSNSLNLKIGTTYTYSFYGYTALSTSTNAGISFYPMMYNSAGTRDTSSTLPISVMGGTFTNSNAKQIGKLNTTPQLYWATFTWNQTMADIIANGGKIELSIQIHGTFDTGRIDYLWAPKLELGDKPTTWTPSIEEMGIDPTKIEDSSGYNHNGEIFGDLITVSGTKRYSYATKWNCSDPTTNNATGKCYIKAPLTLYTPLQMSVSWWAKPENGYGGGVAHAAFCTSNGDSYSAPTDYNRTAFHHRDGAFDIYPSDASGVKRLTLAYTKNEWHHYVVTYDGTTAKVYKDGAEAASVTVGTNKTLSTFTLIYIGYSQAGGVQRKTLGTYSDFRVYCTALNTDAIRQLYQVGAKVDNKGNLHTFELNETNAKEITKAGVAKFNYIGELIDYNSKAEIGKIIHPNLLEGSNKIGSSTVHGWVSNGSATNMEILHDNILHYSYNLSNTKNIPSITTNTTVSCELGKIYTYTMELKFDKEIVLGNSVPMHYWAGARNTNAITNTACNGNLSGITVGWILNHSGHLQPNTWVKIVTRFTFPSAISNSSYPYPAIRCFVYGGVLPEAYTGLVNVWMRNCKVEEGTESTPWVPHINDGCSSITTSLPGWINTTELIEL